jgi:hypothetical protein
MSRLSDPGSCTPCTLLLLTFLRDATPVDGVGWGSAQGSPLGELLSEFETSGLCPCDMERLTVAWVDELVRKGRIHDRILGRESGQWPRTRAAAQDVPNTLAERYVCVCIQSTAPIRTRLCSVRITK